jgi:transcriptional regulator with XRE-family HTH domain
MDIKIKIGNRIKELRAKKDLSQNDLAFYAGLDRSYLASVESGKRNVSIVNIEKITSALEVSLKDFFDVLDFEEIVDLK